MDEVQVRTVAEGAKVGSYVGRGWFYLERSEPFETEDRVVKVGLAGAVQKAAARVKLAEEKVPNAVG